MERRIKTLYIITIIAILTFLGMQSYWLYGRYTFSIKEYEQSTYKQIVATVDEYNVKRWNKEKSNDGDETLMSNYNFDRKSDSIGNNIIIATITWSKFDPYKILGLKGSRKITEEESRLVSRIIMDKPYLAEVRKISYDASNAPSDGAVWSAFKNADTEYTNPMKISDIDSMLQAKGIEGEVSLMVTDNAIWLPTFERNASVADPTTIIKVPYSELEGKSLIVKYRLPVYKIFEGMLGSLVVVTILSVFLITCLILQFSTVLKLSRLDKMRNSFVTTMIHELKRPISTLKMCVSGIGSEKMMSNAATRSEILKETRIALDNLSAYFSKLRDITFNTVEQIPLDIQTIHLHSLFDSVASATIIPADKIVTITNGIDKNIEISADRSHLFNILTNLVENSIKYSGASVIIRAKATESNGIVEIHLSDTGNGIPSGELRHIFRRFYRGKASSGEQPGIGLGLAYVKLLTEAHGGEIAVESSEGKGTCFTIRLPQ